MFVSDFGHLGCDHKEEGALSFSLLEVDTVASWTMLYRIGKPCILCQMMSLNEKQNRREKCLVIKLLFLSIVQSGNMKSSETINTAPNVALLFLTHKALIYLSRGWSIRHWRAAYQPILHVYEGEWAQAMEHIYLFMNLFCIHLLHGIIDDSWGIIYWVIFRKISVLCWLYHYMPLLG